MLPGRRSTSRIDLCDFNALVIRDQTSNHHLITNYFPSSSPPPMSYRDLRLVMSKTPSTNIVIVPKPFPFHRSSDKNPELQSRKKSAKQKSKHHGIDVYRTLSRSESPGTLLLKRDLSQDEIILVSNSSPIDQSSLSSTTGFFHPQNLPSVQKTRFNYRRIGSSKTQLSYSTSPSLRIQPMDNLRPKSTRLSQFSSPIDEPFQYINEEIKEIVTKTPEKQGRKQLHVYLPQIYSC